MNDRWRALIERYLASVAERRPVLAAAAVALAEATADRRPWWTEEAFATLRQEAHKLAGSSGSVGFAALGRHAAALDVLAQGIADDLHGVGPAGQTVLPQAVHAAQLALLTDALLTALGGLKTEDSSLLTPQTAEQDQGGFADGRLRQLVVIGTDAGFRRLVEYVATADGWLVSVAAAPGALAAGSPPDLAVLLPTAGQPLEDWMAAFAPPTAVLTLPLLDALWPAAPAALGALFRRRIGLTVQSGSGSPRCTATP